MAQFNSDTQKFLNSTLTGKCVDATYAISNGWGALFPIWRMRSRSRAVLRDLTPEQLTDVGISSTAAQREGAKWFWQA